MRVLAGHRREQVAGLHLGGADRHAGDLDAVERAAVLEAELLHEACQGPRRRVLGSQDRGDPRTHLALPPVIDVIVLSASRRRHQVVGRLGAPSDCGVMRKVLMTCFMIALKAGAAAAEVLIVSGFAKVTTMAYCGSPAGTRPATETMRSSP